MYPFRKLSVWRRAHALVLAVHEVTERSDRGRHASLIDLTRRASASVAANIVKGSAQATSRQFAQYLTSALNAAKELDYHVLLARDLGVIPLSDVTRLEARIDQVCGMLAVLRLRVLQGENRRPPGRPGHVSLPFSLRHPTSG
jgi:four helix bundle protein